MIACNEAVPNRAANDNRETTSNSKPTMADFDQHKIRDGIWVVPNFAQEVLGIDHTDIMTKLARYPTREPSDAIQPMEVQWVKGDHAALKSRGKPVKRNKMWLQHGCPENTGFLIYSYTGHQAPIIPAQADVNKCPEMKAPMENLRDWANERGQKPANHIIATDYPDGRFHIG